MLHSTYVLLGRAQVAPSPKYHGAQLDRVQHIVEFVACLFHPVNFIVQLLNHIPLPQVVSYQITYVSYPFG